MGFKDHFSTQAATYAAARPSYPPALFAFLADQVMANNNALDTALDVATGNGQAATGLAKHFRQVLACDASQAQIDNATPVPNITFSCAPADALPAADNSVDLVTVAQALHWFPLDAFYGEVRRVLKPGGLIATIAYGLHQFDDPAIDRIMNHLYSEVLGAYWPSERFHIEQGYRSLAFPFERLETPQFAMPAQWTLTSLEGYFTSWSATQRYIKQHGENPIPKAMATIADHWGQPDATRQSNFPLFIQLGRV
ncbi:MAG: class I SAM-dependent methyltransferase [Pseudomonadota bacterium]